MEEKEKYGVELEAETSNFKKQMQDLANTSKKAGQQIKDNLKLKFDDIKSTFTDYSDVMKDNFKKTYSDLKNTIKESYGLKEIPITTDYDKQIKAVKNEMQDLIITINKLKETSKDGSNKQEIIDTETELEKLQLKLNTLFDKRIDVLNWEQTEQYINQLEIKLENLRETYNNLLNQGNKVPTYTLDLVKNKIKNIEFEIKTAKDTLVEFNDEGNRTNNIFGGLGAVVSKGFKDTSRNIKRLALSMVGVHSAYFLISRAVSTYSQYDIATTQKMKSAWASLGAFLAPIVQTIGTLVQKAVGYLNVFITALTGTDYIQKANDAYKYSQSVKAIGKNAKEATKSLTAMDEITNIPEESSGSGSGGADDFNPFETLQQVELNQEWVKKIQEIAKALQPVYKVIKDIIKWCIDHPDVVAGMLGGIALLTLLGKVIGYAGAGTVVGTGLAGILGVLLAIAGIGIIIISIKTIWDEGKKLKEDMDKLTKNFNKNSKKVQKIGDEFVEVSKKIERTDEKFKKYLESLESGAKKSNEHAKETLKNVESWNLFEKAINDITGATKQQGSAFYNSMQYEYTYLRGMEELYKQGKLSKEEQTEYAKAVQNFRTTLHSAGYDVDDSKNKLKLTDEQMKTLKKQYDETGTAYEKYGDKVKNTSKTAKQNITDVKDEVNKIPTKKTIEVEANTDTAKTKLKKLGLLIGTIISPTIAGVANFINKIRSYDVGTPYVPEDGLAMIHKGERIIPAKFNNENLFNGGNNETTNALLVELIQAVEENGEKTPVFNINGREFAKATYNDYQNEGNRLNQSITIRRV